VECAAIATRYLGASFDIQAGGRDLIFPHHELSASHARVALAGQGAEVFARGYAHSGMVRLTGTKMSKSLGNLVFVSQLREAGTDPMAIRLAILAHHYREDWDWTSDGLDAAARRLDRWRAAVAVTSSSPGVPSAVGGSGPAADGVQATTRAAGHRVPPGAAVLATIRERLCADLDAQGAIAAVDAWADALLAAGPGRPPHEPAASDATGSDDGDGTVSEAAESASLVRNAVDALLGIAI
jgi:L-cysteine:1D-myo-inositol 2-amino-2-deoxy-alpha-D-glucopyranoside ligase